VNFRPHRWILNSRDFTYLSSTRFLVTFATQIQAVAVGWLVYEIKKDPLYLGLIGLTEAVPAIGLALLAGWIVDRGRPLTIYRRAVIFEALSAFLLWVVCADFFKLAGGVQLSLIFFAAFLTGTARAFLAPSQFSILPLTVDRSQLGQATAWNTSLNQIAALSGPALGGFLYALGGGATTFFVILLFLLIGRLAAGQIVAGNELRKPDPSKPPLTEALLSGVRFVFASQIILGAMALDMFGVLFGGANALFPIFADLFARGPIGLGILRAAMPVGSFLMGWFLIRVPVSRFSGRIMFVAFLGFGACMIGFGLSQSFYFSIARLVITGMCDSVSMVTRQTILQLTTPQEMRGRVASVSSIFIGSSNEIGAFESGLAAKLLGTRPSVVFGGIMTLIVVATTWIAAPKLRKIELSKL
jgi:MFS family permease